MGADCVLLIVSALTPRTQSLSHRQDIGFDVLIEVHDQRNLSRTITEPTLIGINNRNLKTFGTSLNTHSTVIQDTRRCNGGHRKRNRNERRRKRYDRS